MFGSLPLGFLLRVLFLLVCAPSAINAALENSTIDNQDFSKIDYEPSSFWSHGPLLGYYPEFYNGSSSYTWTPGANATFVFTGSGIYIRGPYSPNQAIRRIFLDGKDMGQFVAYAPETSQSAVFWGKWNLEYTTHTIVVAHNDTPSKLLAVDEFLVEFDPTQTPLPYSTTTTTVTTTTPTSSSTPSSTSDSDDISKHLSYSNIIIGIVVPVLFLLLICIVGLYIWYRNRRSRHRQRRDSVQERLFRSRTPISIAHTRNSGVNSRPISFHSIATTHYSTAEEHLVESTRNNMENLPDIHELAIHPTLVSRANLTNASHTSLELRVATPASSDSNSRSVRSVATFIPPAEWRTTLTSPVEPVSDASPSAEPPSPIHHSPIAAPPSAWVNPSERPHHVSNRPSTVFSETDSNNSVQQPNSRRASNPRAIQRPPSVLRRFSAALTSPFTRAPSRAASISSQRDSTQQGQGAPGPHNPDNGGPGYFRGMNHFNLGIPLNYTPVASQSPTETSFPRQSRASEQPVDREGGTSSGDPTPSTPGRSRAGLDDLMMLGYTQQAHKKGISGNRASEDDTIEDDEKPEKIVENLDGSTMQDSASRHEREETWSTGHVTVASQADLARPESVARSSTSDRNGQVTPPPYTVLIPPEVKRPMDTE